jgi:drug/metabolite transporter (DMT)-like permease
VAAEEKDKKLLQGAMLVLLSGISYAPVAVAGKICVEGGVTPGTLNVLRLTIAVSFLGLFALNRVRAGRRLPVSAMAIAFVFGSFVWALGGLFFFISLQMIDASLAYLLMYIYPAVVLFISVSLGWERFKFSKALAALIAITGVALVMRVGGGSYANLIGGVAFVMGTTLFYSVYVVIYDRFLVDHSAALISFFTMFGGLVLIVALIPLNGFDTGFIGSDPSLLLPVAVTAFGSVGSIVFFLQGIKHIGASWASIISTVQPLLVVLLSWLLLGEVMGPMQLFGALLLVLGVVMIRWEKKPSVKAAT